MRAYLSLSYSKRKMLNAEIGAIREMLLSFKIESVVFVDEFRFGDGEEKKMMQQAMRSIDDCDILIAEVSDKAIGIGVEAGYAKAKGKTVIYLRNIAAEHSTTLSGISDLQVLYTNIDDLKNKLCATLVQFIKVND